MEKSRLIELILENTDNYYNGKPCVSDATWDAWLDELKQIDPDNRILHSVGWGYDLSKCNKKKYSHLSYCGGISNKPKVAPEEILPSGMVKTPKMDGGSVELQYVHGIFTRALTRGDGNYGFDCTSKLQFAQGVISNLGVNYTGNVIGEYVLSTEDMDSEDSISQRNIPNGFLGRDSASEEECRRFSFVAYRIGRSNVHFTSRVGILNFLRDLGFLTAGYIMNSMRFDELKEKLRVVGGKHYLVDGIVADNPEVICHESGSIEYIGTVAYKTITDRKDTTIERIDWNLTRTGRMIPTAVLTQLELSGANVSRALAHNAWNVLSSGIGAGAIVEVIRSGEVIPYIMDVQSPVEAELPTVCPACGAKLEWDGVHLVCNNPECSGQNFSNLYHWFANIGGTDKLGGSLIRAVIEGLEIEDISDFYKDFDLDRLSDLDGIGPAKVQTIKTAFLRLSEPHSLEHYLVALNIPQLSWKNASKIVAGTSIREEVKQDYFSSEFEDELINLKGVNYKTKLNLVKYWGRIADNYKFMNIQAPEIEPSSSEQDDRIKVCITGKIITESIKSKFYSAHSDCIVESNVNSCDYLICNEDKDSSKLKTARKLNKPIVTEQEFLRIIKRGE